MSGELVARYVGRGSFYGGVPARDLEEGDWARLNEGQRAAVEGGHLYVMVSPDGENGASEQVASERLIHEQEVSAAAIAESDDASDTAENAAEVSFTAVLGIGPALARSLDAMGIRTMDDLAMAEVGALRDGLGVSLKKAKEWVAAAKAIVGSG